MVAMYSSYSVNLPDIGQTLLGVLDMTRGYYSVVMPSIEAPSLS